MKRKPSVYVPEGLRDTVEKIVNEYNAKHPPQEEKRRRMRALWAKIHEEVPNVG